MKEGDWALVANNIALGNQYLGSKEWESYIHSVKGEKKN